MGINPTPIAIWEVLKEPIAIGSGVSPNRKLYYNHKVVHTCIATAGGCTHKDICFGARPAGLTCTGMQYKENISLYPYTHFKTGGPARYFFSVNKPEDIVEAVAYAREKELPWFALGGGSNVLVSDNGFNGVVVKNEITGVTYEDNGDVVDVVAGAGEDWDALVAETTQKGLYGIENLSLIPGTVGAAPVQNIGAYGAEIKTVIKWVEVFDARSSEIKKLSNDACQFSYRNSVFKKHDNPFVVTRICMTLQKEAALNTTYPDVEHFFAEENITHPTLAETRNAIVSIRKSKLPPRGVGTAGSFFQNPMVSVHKKDELIKTFPNMVWFSAGGARVKLAAGWLIEHLSVGKGCRIGDVGTHSGQALVLVNFGEQNAQEIYDFARRIENDVYEQTGITLPFEVNVVGEFGDL